MKRTFSPSPFSADLEPLRKASITNNQPVTSTLLAPIIPASRESAPISAGSTCFFRADPSLATTSTSFRVLPPIVKLEEEEAELTFTTDRTELFSSRAAATTATTPSLTPRFKPIVESEDEGESEDEEDKDKDEDEDEVLPDYFSLAASTSPLSFGRSEFHAFTEVSAAEQYDTVSEALCRDLSHSLQISKLGFNPFK